MSSRCPDGHRVDPRRHDAVRFNQKLNTQLARPFDGRLQLFTDGEQPLFVREVVPERGFGIAFRSDDVPDIKKGRQPDRFDDLEGSVNIGRRRVQQVGVRAKRGEFDPGGFRNGTDPLRMAVEAD